MGPIAEIERFSYGGTEYGPDYVQADDGVSVWVPNGATGDARIRVYDSSTGAFTILAEGGAWPDVSGRTVVWEDNPAVRSYDLDTAQYETLVPSPDPQLEPKWTTFESSTVAWAEYDFDLAKHTGVYMAQGPGWTPTAICAETESTALWPHIDGQRIVYSYSNQDTGWHGLRVYDVQTSSQVYEISTDVYEPTRPHISGNRIACSVDNGTRVWDIATAQQWWAPSRYFALDEDVLVYYDWDDSTLYALDLSDDSTSVLRTGASVDGRDAMALDGYRLTWVEELTSTEWVVYTAMIPEPATLTLLIVSGVLLLKRRPKTTA
ncbi:MAG: TolB-like translocation protein [Planctomycetota bacterium]